MVVGCISCWDIFHLSPPMPSAKRPVILTILLGIRLKEEDPVVDKQTALTNQERFPSLLDRGGSDGFRE